MNISEPFIKRPVATSLIMFAVVIFGFFAYRILPVASMPSIAYPVIQVTTNYPGAGPEDVTKFISSPLERQFMLMQGIQFVSTNNTYQTSTIILQFHFDVDINVAAEQVQNAINQALGQMPKNLPQNPNYVKTNPSDTPITYLIITSDTMSAQDLYTWGYTYVAQQLGVVEGVANIQTFGFPYAVRVKVDPQALAAKNIGMTDLASAINNQNPLKPTGKFFGDNWSITMQADGQIYDADAYNDLVIKFQDGQPIRVSDIGHAYPSVQNDKQPIAWVTKDGKSAAVALGIYKQPQYNTVQVCDNLMNVVARLKNELPANVDLIVPYNQAEWILQAVEDVDLTLLIAFLLVVVIVFVYLGKVRNSIIPLITLPVTIAGTFALMFPFNFSVDILSMSALTLAIGFLVDDAIIVLENIIRYVEKGMDPYKASITGSGQIIVTVLSISLCLAAVFMPMLFWQGAIGSIFNEFAAVILIAVLLSGVVSLALTPMLCSRFIPVYKAEDKSGMEKFSLAFNAFFYNLYEPALLFSVRHRFLLLLVALASVGGSFYFLHTMPKSFLPENDLGIVQGFLQAQDGNSPIRLAELVDQASKIVVQEPMVSSFISIESYPSDSQALFWINLNDKSKNYPGADAVIKTMMEKLSDVPGLLTFMKPFPLFNLNVGGVDSGKANYQYILQSFDETALTQSAARLMEKLHESPKLSMVSSDFYPDAKGLQINFLRDQAKAYGNISVADIENSLMYAYGETYISQINRPENAYYVILEADDTKQKTPEDLSLLYVANRDGKQVAANSIIQTKQVQTPLAVNRINALSSVTIAFNPGPNTPLSEAVDFVSSAATETLDPNVMGALAGNTDAFQKSIVQLLLLMTLAIFIIYIILGVLYENFIYPIVPLSVIPVAALGGLLSLFICNESLSIYAMVGIIMLLGIVMKNGILLIDFALEEMQQGKNAQEAIVAACNQRFRPILMTTLAAMMGSVPIALGIGGTVAQGRAPLGIAVVGGLIFSQCITLFVTPVIFLYISNFNGWITTRFRFFKSHEELNHE